MSIGSSLRWPQWACLALAQAFGTSELLSKGVWAGWLSGSVAGELDAWVVVWESGMLEAARCPSLRICEMLVHNAYVHSCNTLEADRCTWRFRTGGLPEVEHGEGRRCSKAASKSLSQDLGTLCVTAEWQGSILDLPVNDLLLPAEPEVVQRSRH